MWGVSGRGVYKCDISGVAGFPRGFFGVRGARSPHLGQQKCWPPCSLSPPPSRPSSSLLLPNATRIRTMVATPAASTDAAHSPLVTGAQIALERLRSSGRTPGSKKASSLRPSSTKMTTVLSVVDAALDEEIGDVMRDLEALKSRRILGSYGLAHLQHRLTEAEAQAKLAEHAAHACREERVVATERALRERVATVQAEATALSAAGRVRAELDSERAAARELSGRAGRGRARRRSRRARTRGCASSGASSPPRAPPPPPPPRSRRRHRRRRWRWRRRPRRRRPPRRRRRRWRGTRRRRRTRSGCSACTRRSRRWRRRRRASAPAPSAWRRNSRTSAAASRAKGPRSSRCARSTSCYGASSRRCSSGCGGRRRRRATATTRRRGGSTGGARRPRGTRRSCGSASVNSKLCSR